MVFRCLKHRLKRRNWGKHSPGLVSTQILVFQWVFQTPKHHWIWRFRHLWMADAPADARGLGSLAAGLGRGLPRRGRGPLRVQEPRREQLRELQALRAA